MVMPLCFIVRKALLLNLFDKIQMNNTLAVYCASLIAALPMSTAILRKWALTMTGGGQRVGYEEDRNYNADGQNYIQ